MSNTIIEDGTGKGFKVKVSSQNHLQVDAIGVEEITHISSSYGAAYTFHMERTMLAANTFEDVGFFTYTGNYKLQVDTIVASREDVALVSGDQAVVEIMTGVTYTSGGASITASNLNLGSSNILAATGYSGATTLVTDNSNEDEILDVAFRDTFQVDLDGALILNKGDSISLIAKSKNIGDTVHVTVSLYEVTEVI